VSPDFEVPGRGDLDAWFQQLRNWDRWGGDDQRGTLHHLSADGARRATATVTAGRSISLAFDLRADPAPDNPFPVHHHMLAAGDARDANGIAGYEAARDYIGLDVHGLTTTHVDALSHMFVDGVMYGGRPASEVRSDGARSNTVMTMAEGVVGRGVLVDVPRTLGIDFLGPGALVTRSALEASLAEQAVRPEPGDIVLVRWGRVPRRQASPAFDGFSGLHPDCLPWLQEQCVAVLGSDGISDPMPGLDIEGWPFPIHQVGITAMGLHLIDNMALEALAGACAENGRWEFLFTMAPLRVPGATGCPINPVAVL
jgi:kynurenine formamidase